MNIKKIGIIGAGTMGNGIAHVFSIYGYSVILVDINDKILESALATITNNMKRQVNKGIIDELKLKESISIII